MKPRLALASLPLVLLGCAASTPPPQSQPQPAPTGEVAVVDLNATKPPPPVPKPGEAKYALAGSEDAKKLQSAGILGLINTDGQGAAGEEVSARGNMWGDSIGDSFGAGGLGLVGTGPGAGGTGEGIGLGSIGTLGHGAGTGTGQGFGSGQGRLGGAHSKTPPKIVMGATSVSGRLPPEVIQRIVRQNFGRFRLCYENGLRNNPKLEGKINVRFVIGKDGAVTRADGQGSDLPDNNVVNCVVKAFNGLTFPQPEGGVVAVTYPIKFLPGDDAADAKKPADPLAPAAKPAPAPAPAPSAPAPAKRP